MTMISRMLCRLLIVMMAWTPMHLAHAGMIGTQQAVAPSAQSERAALMNVVTRSDVARQLQSLGLDAATAKQRVAAMSDSEIRSLMGRIDALPAGADSGAGILLLVVIALVVWWAWK